jgi:tetratricopeptide (TPR) repeat protein
MPRKIRRPPPFVLTAPTPRVSRSPVWLICLLTAILAAAIGACATYLALRPSLKRVAALQAALAAQSAPPTGPGVPPSRLTAGLDPAHAALNLGNWYEDQGGQAQSAGDMASVSADYARSIADYSLAIADGLDNPDIRTDLGVAYYRSGQPRKALEEYQNAQKQDPDHENSLFNQGAAYAVLGRTAKAIATWKTYLRRFPHGQHDDDARQLIAEVQTHGLAGPAGRSPAP